MVKKFFRITGIVLGSILLLCGILYLATMAYYSGTFLPGTVISGHRADHLHVEDVDQMLKKDATEYKMVLQLKDGAETAVNGSGFDYEVDYTESLTKILKSQKLYEWGWYYLYGASYRAEPAVTYDEGKLLACLNDLNCFRQEDENKDAVVAIENRMNHFTLRDDRKEALNPDSAAKLVISAVKKGDSFCDLSGAYEAPKATSLQERVLDRWETVDKVQNAEVLYTDGELSLMADRHEIARWIATDANKQPVLDANGDVIINEDAVRDFLLRLSDIFNTDQKNRVWTKFKGGTVEIPSRNKGFIVDEEAELASLTKTVVKGWKEQRKPIYSQEGLGHGNEEVGDTYVEVDLSNQKLYYIENGKLKLQSDVVTGCKRYHNDTPSMITSIYFMQQGRTLRGENYATFVYYWMAFYNHYGLHDATWRSKFGGDIYLTDGSHGCVNMPKENAAKLYDMVHVGTPVVLYE